MSCESGNRCKGVTKDGKPCQAPPTAGGLCYFHANPDQARLLGKIGGRKNRRQTEDLSLSPPTDAAEVREMVAQAMVDVRNKTLAPREAGAIASLANTFLHSIQVSDVEERLAKIEERMQEEGDRMPAAAREKVVEPEERVRWWYTEEEGVEPESSPTSASS